MLKWISAAFLALVLFAGAGFAILLILANYSSTNTVFACAGAFTQAGEVSGPDTIYMDLKQFSWWVGFWSDSDGSLWVEIPDRLVLYFSDLTEAGNFIRIHKHDDTFAGQLSTLSGSVSINTIYGVFDGQCTPAKRLIR